MNNNQHSKKRKTEEIDWNKLKEREDNPKMIRIDYEGAKEISAHCFYSNKLKKTTN